MEANLHISGDGGKREEEVPPPSVQRDGNVTSRR